MMGLDLNKLIGMSGIPLLLPRENQYCTISGSMGANTIFLNEKSY
jgi:hypothetical protein